MSNKFVWTNEYSVSIPGIDEQHKEFLSIVNSLFDLADDKTFTDREAVAIIGKLINYSLYHLSTEEYIFAQTGFTGAPEHIATHDIFREKVISFEIEISDKNKDKKLVVREMAEFAGNWLMQHILIMDKKYSKIFIEKGIQ